MDCFSFLTHMPGKVNTPAPFGMLVTLITFIHFYSEAPLARQSISL